MGTDQRDLLTVLKAELKFLKKGGYRESSSWRPRFIFEDSPTCFKRRDPQDSRPCSECVLLQLVPPDKRQEKIPCQHIALNEMGTTLQSLYRTATEEELETEVENWLTAKIRALEKERADLGLVRQGPVALQKAASK